MAKTVGLSPILRAVTGGTGVFVLALTLAVSGASAQAVAATDYPSWSDVQDAQASESAKAAQVTELENLIVLLASEATAAEQMAVRRGNEYELAQAAFDAASYRATELRVQATDAAEQAELSGTAAGQFAAMLARSGSGDLSMTLLLDPPGAEDLLSQLGTMSKLTERTSEAYEQAATDRNAADSVTEQAELAESILGELAVEAEAALTAAIEARAEAQEKLASQQENEAIMRAQLAVLTQNRQATEADYAKGEEARRAAEAEAGGGNGGLDSGQLSDQGWAKPVSGWISDRYGPRPNKPVPGVNPFHSGTDIAAGCDQPVYAATGGTVIYADWLGTYGLWVLIDHGNGVQTGYAHNNDIFVGVGQYVAAGANIAAVGSTGASTGCHLHFEVRVDGARIDPQPFMSARGVNLG